MGKQKITKEQIVDIMVYFEYPQREVDKLMADEEIKTIDADYQDLVDHMRAHVDIVCGWDMLYEVYVLTLKMSELHQHDVEYLREMYKNVGKTSSPS